MNRQRFQEISDHTTALVSKRVDDDDILMLAGFIFEMGTFATQFAREGEHRKFDVPSGTKPATCRGCAAVIFWIDTKRGKKMPVNEDGTSHFSSCSHADGFRKEKS